MMCLSLLIVFSLTVTARCVNSSFDISEEFQLNLPRTRYSLVNGKRCLNTAAFALLDSLDIAYTRATGIRKEFSEQEIVDCYWKGCGTTSLNKLVTWLRTVDRLAPYDKYTPLLGRSEVCRAKTAPDGLDKIKIIGTVKVTVENFEKMIQKYGSVIACYDTDKKICPEWARYTGGIMEGKKSNICRQYVVIVGFTSSYYRVREAKGLDWGNEGYFLIKRGGNDCGIEHYMMALVTELRSVAKSIAYNGCPLEFPKYCESAKTCAKDEQECITEDEKEEEERCVDKSKFCAHNAQHCRISHAMQINCPKTCNIMENCGTKNKPVVASEGSKGKCDAPEVANGVVLNAGDMLEHGELLKIQCDEGYVLAGAPNNCLVLNLYAPDSRMVQMCVKDGGETFLGRGMDYSGVKHTAVDGTECDNWYNVVMSGYNAFYHQSLEVERLQELAVKAENHNFCRNYFSDQPVPYCYVAGGRKKFCFSKPGCDERCEHPVNEYEYCEEHPYEDCYYRNGNEINRPDNTWKYCTRMCCEAVDCLKS